MDHVSNRADDTIIIYQRLIFIVRCNDCTVVEHEFHLSSILLPLVPSQAIYIPFDKETSNFKNLRFKDKFMSLF